MTDLSIVILCYHSGITIKPFFDKLELLLKGASVDYEIVLVANDFANSKDRSISIRPAAARWKN